jgi:hypothetical protein
MPRKKKLKKFRAVETVKAMARERIGTPKASRVVLDRKKKRLSGEKHVPTIEKLMEDW